METFTLHMVDYYPPLDRFNTCEFTHSEKRCSNEYITYDYDNIINYNIISIKSTIICHNSIININTKIFCN